MESMDPNKEQTDNLAQSSVDTKIVTLGGKQVEVKYEYRRRRVDIFGLHGGNRRNGNENRRPPKSYPFRGSDGTQNIGHRRPSVERHITNIDNNNNKSNTSIDSKESSINESLKSLSKVDKLMRKLENNDGSNRRNSSIERLANKLKKDKEPVKMTNRFDRLLSSVNTEDLNVGSVKISAKKNRKKKNKSSVDSFDDKNDNNFDESGNQNLIIAQNDTQIVSSDSVPQTIDSNDFNRKSDILFETNNNNNNLNNYFEKSDDKLIKMNENIEDDQEAQNIKVYKNTIRENNNLLINEFIDEKSGVSDNEGTKRNQLYDMPTPEKLEDNIKTCDFQAVKAQKHYSAEAQNNCPNGVLTNRQKSSKANTSKTNTNQLEQQVMKAKNVPVVSQNSAPIKWLVIITAFVAFLVIYTSLILSRFCNCS